jgi:hypothetical protein
MDKAEEKELERTREKAALAAFGALLAQYRGSKPVKAVAKEAWEAGNLFLSASFENYSRTTRRRYEFALRGLKGMDGLRRVLELDGFRGRPFDWLIGRYKDEPDPLRAYAEDDGIGPKTYGQSLIGLILKL